MKFLFKITLLVLVCMSNSLLGLKSSNPLVGEIDIYDQIENEQIEQEQQILEIEQAIKIAKCFYKIFNSPDCNCAKLKKLNDQELNVIQFELLKQYSTPKSEKRIQKEKEDLTKLFHKFLLDYTGEEEKVEIILEQTTEIMKKTNENMKCKRKILTTINEIRDQNKAE